MREYGYQIEIIKPSRQEPRSLDDRLAPEELAEALSSFKARNVAKRVDRGWVISGDTIVVLNGRVFGKPRDRAEARRVLGTLAGTTHHVITGVTLLNAATEERFVRHDTTVVTMRPIESDEIERYLDTDAWAGKAGAYGIQDREDAFIERIDGSFTNVVGFPMELVATMLAPWHRPHGRAPVESPGP